MVSRSGPGWVIRGFQVQVQVIDFGGQVLVAVGQVAQGEFGGLERVDQIAAGT
jgi:hypothetical protein